MSNNMEKNFISDYENWKQWFDMWSVEYKENTFSDGSKSLEVDGDTAAAIIEFDAQNNFVRVNASE